MELEAATQRCETIKMSLSALVMSHALIRKKVANHGGSTITTGSNSLPNSPILVDGAGTVVHHGGNRLHFREGDDGNDEEDDDDEEGAGSRPETPEDEQHAVKTVPTRMRTGRRASENLRGTSDNGAL